jgi:hypothetical protein
MPVAHKVKMVASCSLFISARVFGQFDWRMRDLRWGHCDSSKCSRSAGPTVENRLDAKVILHNAMQPRFFLTWVVDFHRPLLKNLRDAGQREIARDRCLPGVPHGLDIAAALARVMILSCSSLSEGNGELAASLCQARARVCVTRLVRSKFCWEERRCWMERLGGRSNKCWCWCRPAVLRRPSMHLSRRAAGPAASAIFRQEEARPL